MRILKCGEKIPNISRNIAGYFYPAIGNTGVIPLHYQLPFFFFCQFLFSCTVPKFMSYCQTAAPPTGTTAPRYPLIMACKYFHEQGFLGTRKIILGIPPWGRKKKGWKTPNWPTVQLIIQYTMQQWVI